MNGANHFYAFAAPVNSQLLWIIQFSNGIKSMLKEENYISIYFLFPFALTAAFHISIPAEYVNCFGD